MVSDKNKTVSINIIQGLKLILTKGSSASDTEAEVRVEKLWWYRR
jgi:copper homeostasis protein CutC